MKETSASSVGEVINLRSPLFPLSLSLSQHGQRTAAAHSDYKNGPGAGASKLKLRTTTSKRRLNLSPHANQRTNQHSHTHTLSLGGVKKNANKKATRFLPPSRAPSVEARGGRSPCGRHQREWGEWGVWRDWRELRWPRVSLDRPPTTNGSVRSHQCGRFFEVCLSSTRRE